MKSRTPLLMLLAWLAVTTGMWMLAFYRMPETTPEWLLRAQSVCFGTTESGLPDASGWILLVLSPLLFLFVFGAAYANELMTGIVHAYRTITGKIIMLLLAFAISSEAAWITEKIRAGKRVENATFDPVGGESLPEEYPRSQEPAFPFSLTDQLGNVGGPADFKGTPFILSFAFANCQTICPAILAQLKRAVEALDHQIPVLIVTLDPWRDRPSKLDTMAQLYELGPRSRLYSGEVDKVLEVLNKYHVPISRNEQDGEITHPPLVYIIDAEGRIAYTFSNPSAGWITNAIARIER